MLWKARFVLAMSAAALAVVMGSNDRTAAQAPDPRNLPLLQQSNLEYLGRFRLPSTTINGQTFTFAQGLVAYNPAGDGGNGSLVFGWGNLSGWTSDFTARMTEVKIPEPKLDADINSLNMAQYVAGQGFVDPTEGHLDEVPISPAYNDYIGLNGLMVHGDRIIGTAYSSYDASGTTVQWTHYSRSINLSQPSFVGWSNVWEAGQDGYVGGYMTNVPTEWQSALGGAALTGMCCVSIVSRTSWGPAAFSFDPASIGQSLIAANPLLYYNGDHPTLGVYDPSDSQLEPNDKWGQTTSIRGAAIINGTRTLLFFGRTGIGVPCYGPTIADPSRHREIRPEGHRWCYDPTSNASGNHAWPYRHQLWAYDLNDLADVNANPPIKNPWQPVPQIWPLNELPANTNEAERGLELRTAGIAYAPQTKRLYVVTDKMDPDGYSARPLVYVYKVTIPAGNTVNDVSVTADRAAPQPPNTAITFTAAPSGGVTPYQYQWKVFNGSTWTYEPWTASSTFQWNPTSANANYRVGVGVRSSGNSGSAEASNDMAFAISSGGGSASAISISADVAAPQAAGTPIHWTAVVTGGTGPLEYKWWWWDGGSSHDQTGWTTSSTFTWTPIWGNANYAIKAWVRSAGNSVNAPEAETEQPYPTTGPGPATAVSVSASHASPQPLGTTITWTATPTGGAPPQQYKWLVLGANGWEVAKEWSTDTTFVWTPTVAGSGHRISVWVRSAGVTGDVAEATVASEWYTIQ